MSTPDAQDSNVTVAPLTEQVFDTLRGWIVTGQLEPGYRLRVRDVAELVGTSVMPVREAIRQLVHAGLAVHEPYKGAKVRGLDVGELEHAYDVRILLEGEGARLGANAGGAAVADRMQDHWNALAQAALEGKVNDALLHDEHMLDELYQAADNDVLLDIVHGLWDRCRPYKVLWATDAAKRNDASVWRYKPELIKAVRDGDGDTAQEVIRHSYLIARNSLRTMLSPH